MVVEIVCREGKGLSQGLSHVVYREGMSIDVQFPEMLKPEEGERFFFFLEGE